MSETDVASKTKKRKRSGKKSQMISFDEEIVPKNIAEQFIKPEKNNSKESEVIQKKPRNKTKKKVVVENPESLNAEPHQSKIKKRKKKLSLSEKNITETTEKDTQEEATEPSDEQLLHEDAEVDPSNPVVKKEESKRSLKKKKYQKLLLDKKVKVDLVLQEKSLNYLSRWKHNQSEWKFEKLRQVWLQQNMFDCDKIPERFWTTVVEYFSGSKGQIRKTIVDEALKIIKQSEHEENNEKDEKEENEVEDNINKVQRARDVIQSLQE